MFSGAKIQIIIQFATSRANFLLLFGTLLVPPRAMMQRHRKYRVAILADDNTLAAEICTAIACNSCHAMAVIYDGALHRMIACGSIDLVIVASTHYSPNDNTFYNYIERLRSTGVDIFVITTHKSVRHTMHLLTSGVRQCLTLPIATARLRRKVYEHLATIQRVHYTVS